MQIPESTAICILIIIFKKNLTFMYQTQFIFRNLLYILFCLCIFLIFFDFLVCEYMHGMGNSIGGMGSYMELLGQYEMYQGGFLWDFIDQAIQVEDEVTGKKVLRYGGDFDDRPSDYEFSGNGIVFADRQEKPAIQEVRYYYGLYR